MLTPKDIIDRVKEDFSCTLSEERLIDMLSSFEIKLALEVIKKKGFIRVSGQKRVSLPRNCGGVTSVMMGNICLKKDEHYTLRAGELVFNKGYDDIKIEYLEIPKPFSVSDFSERALSLGEQNAEVYIFHLLCREALICEDIERLNNYSELYAEALKSLSVVRESTSNFKNIW